MKFLTSKVALILIPVLLITIAGIAGRRTIGRIFDRGFENEASRETVNMSEEEKQLINELVVLGNQFRSKDSILYIESLFSAIDNADTPNAIRKVPYKVFVAGTEMYTRFGNTEFVNTRDIYVYADHAMKKIIAGPQKSTSFPMLYSSEKMISMIADEGYRVRRNIDGGAATISLVNDTHVSCTEYSVKYDTVSRKVLSIHSVVPDVYENMNLEKRRSTILDISYYDTLNTHRSLLNAENFIKNKSALQLSDKYQGYELVTQ